LIVIKNIQYHFNEDEEFRYKQIFYKIKDFENNNIYIEIPLNNYIGKFNGRTSINQKIN
jgi:hypothetical protein